ncbi:unnamed protein product [Rhodiola kirilowii]
MVKLASARESRMYGGRLTRQRAEYMNAGIYFFASVVLLGGFVAELSKEPKAGLVLLLIGLALIAIVNVHDLIAHLAGIDFKMALMEYDAQLGLVEFAVPLVQAVGTLLEFVGILLLLIQEEKGYGYWKLEKHAVRLLIAGPVLWLLGSIHNACQIYERADGPVQILQQSVHIPFLMGSLLFLVGSVINCRNQMGMDHHGTDLLGGSWVWLGIFGSFLFLLGGITNVVKVFKMHQIDGMLRLEKLRGGAHDRLMSEREGQVPLILEEQRKRKKQQVVEEVVIQAGPTPYKDVLLAQS